MIFQLDFKDPSRNIRMWLENDLEVFGLYGLFLHSPNFQPKMVSHS